MAIRLLTFIIALVWSVSCFASGQNRKLVVLFTADLHSQILPSRQDEGGFAKIATLVSNEREQALRDSAAFLLLDGGDISMGSVFHTLFGTETIEYRGMARIGYDAFTLGNHAFDFGTDPLLQMFRNAHAKDSMIAFPQLLCANLQCNGIPSVPYAVLERNGLRIGLFGLMGENSYNVAGKARDSIGFSDPVEAARKIVGILHPQTDYIIAISHGGTLNGDDISLAQKVKGIDFIVSAHDHDILHFPIYAGGTPIGAAGSNGKYVGKAVFQDGELLEYALLHADSQVAEDPCLANWADSMYNVVGLEFEKLSGRRLDDTVTILKQGYPNIMDNEGRMVLGNNIAAAYRDAAIANMPDVSPDRIVGVVPYGVVRNGLHEGVVTNRDVFEVLSLGENENGCYGYPLVYVWITGEELEDLCEMSVSVGPLLEDTRLFFAGLEYSYNGARLPFMRVGSVCVSGREASPHGLYMVVTGSYTAQLIGLLAGESYGILSAVAKNADGEPLAGGYLPLHTASGGIITEWEAFAGYLQQKGFDSAADRGAAVKEGTVPFEYIMAGILLCAAMFCFMRKRK